MPFVVEIARALAGLPAQVRICLRDEPLRLDLMGWRFWYQVDPEKGAVRVLKARRIHGE